MVQDGGLSLEEAVTSYDEDVVKRGAKETDISKFQTFCTHDFETLKKSPAAVLGALPSDS